MNAPYEFGVSGFLAPTNTRIYLETDHGVSRENWIGYFIQEKMDVFDAFAPVLDDISVIRTKRWAIFKLPDGKWISAGGDKVLYYGEMVKVVCDRDCDFCWGDESILPGFDGYRETEYFSFEKEKDYAPIFIELDEEVRLMPEEIAVFLNVECVGASVVQDTLVQINAYVLGDTTGNEIEIEMYYGDRAPIRTISEFAVLDPYTRERTRKKLDFSKRQNVYYINLDIDSEQMVPAVTSMGQNFPQSIQSKYNDFLFIASG